MNTDDIKAGILDALGTLKLSTDNEIMLEHPADESHGDYSTNIAMVLFPQAKDSYQSPRSLAEAIAHNIKVEGTTAGVAGPGFINFHLKSGYFISELSNIITKGDSYGTSTQNHDKKIVVEYSSPNIAKPFTIGHLRSTIIGDSVANILEATGATIFRDNHLGDWGTQFGKQIYAIKEWGSESDIENSQNPVKKLVELYVKFHTEAEADPTLEDKAREWFKKLEDGDPEARRLWQKCIDWSWVEFNRIYQELGVSFTENEGRGYGESYFEDKMAPVIEEVKNKGLLKDSQGAQLVFFPEELKMPPLMLLKKDGATLYATRDLATDKFRKEKYGSDTLVINEVGAEQTLYWQQIHQTEIMLGWYKPEQRVHIGHGMFRFKDEKMSTRKGNVIWLEDVLKEAVERAKKLSKDGVNDVSGQVAIGALKWNDLKRRPNLDVVFDWDEILNMDGNSGPYVQYVHARCCSVLTKAKQEAATMPNEIELNNEELSLLRWLPQFSEVVAESAASYAPHFICTYLFELAQRFNTFYNQHSILGSENKQVTDEQKQLRLALTKATAQILKNGLKLLGITAPEQM